jgi:hypothetical protein
MLSRRAIIAPLCVALAFAGIIAAQRKIDAVKHKAFYDELLYLPNEKLLNHFTAGMSSVIADVLWIRCIHYTAQHFKGDGKFTWLNHMCNMTTRLDPHFAAVYRYGGIFLAALKADDDAGIDLLERGMVRNPDAWELPYEIAMTYLLNRGDQPDSPIHAARYLAMAVETGKAPAFVADVASSLQGAHNLTDIERAMWDKTLANGDPFLRDLAERKLVELNLRETCAALDKAVSIYATRFNHPPRTLEELVSGRIIDALPADPLGGTFFIDAKGSVQNTTVLDSRVERTRNTLRTAIDAYKKTKGQWPASLQDLVAAHIMDALPPHPYPNRTWQYDPVTGDVK